MNLFYRILADAIFILHFILLFIALFGWGIPGLWYLYMGGLVSALVSDLVLGYCILSRWEFALRRKVNPEIEYDYAWSTYYTYKFTNHRIPNQFFMRTATSFLVLSIGLNLYFKFLN